MSKRVTDFFKPSAKKTKTGTASDSETPKKQAGTAGTGNDEGSALAAAAPIAETSASKIAASKKVAQSKRALALLAPLRDAEWRAALEGEASKDYLFALSEFVFAERRKAAVFPPPSHVFAALDACALSGVKVVVVGQDPYHGAGQAHGLSFSIQSGAQCKFPPSLRNILKEVCDDVGVAELPKGQGDLTPWASRGVLLLNTCLTVRSASANSHQKQGWERFTDAVVRAVNTRPGRGVVFVLWGKPAQTKCASIDTRKHRVITSSHPSPLSNSKTATPFTGSKCFSRCNALLAELGWEEGVDWALS